MGQLGDHLQYHHLPNRWVFNGDDPSINQEMGKGQLNVTQRLVVSCESYFSLKLLEKPKYNYNSMGQNYGSHNLLGWSTLKLD